MAIVRVRGWGAGTWKMHIDTLDFPRTRGWGGGRQWRLFCLDEGERIQGYGDGQNKLFCDSAQPPPP